jgi:phage tail tube protein FII
MDAPDLREAGTANASQIASASATSFYCDQLNLIVLCEIDFVVHAR